MARSTYVYCPVAGAVVRKGQQAPRAGGVSIIKDMAETVHPCDGRTYSSRRHYDAVTRAHGGVEVGKTEMKRAMGQDWSGRASAYTAEHAIRDALARLG